ncbi:uncharacterized protein METZ01_LOCUS504290, partial [marine metagenome]
ILLDDEMQMILPYQITIEKGNKLIIIFDPHHLDKSA